MALWLLQLLGATATLASVLVQVTFDQWHTCLGSKSLACWELTHFWIVGISTLVLGSGSHVVAHPPCLRPNLQHAEIQFWVWLFHKVEHVTRPLAMMTSMHPKFENAVHETFQCIESKISQHKPSSNRTWANWIVDGSEGWNLQAARVPMWLL